MLPSLYDLQSLTEDYSFDPLTLAVEGVEFLSQVLRFRLVVSDEKTQRYLGIAQTSRGVQSGRQAEPYRLRVDPRLPVADGHQRPEADFAAGGDPDQAFGHVIAVLPAKRDKVGHRAQRHQVEVRQ